MRYIPPIIAYPFIALIIASLLYAYFIKRRKGILKRPVSYSFKVPVNLENCDITTFDFARHGIHFSEINPFGTYSNPEMYGYNTTGESSNAIYIRFEKGNKKYFAGPIYKDEVTVRVLLRETVRVLLREKKSTFIYVDEVRGRYFFDLAFLYQ